MEILEISLHYFLLGVIWLLLLFSCYTDIRQRRISNANVLLVFIAVLLLFVLGDGELNLLGALISLAIGSVIFYFGFLGAGDVKMVVVLMLSLELTDTLSFFSFIAFIGFFQAVIALAKSRSRDATIPYGVAISTSYMLVTSNIT